MCLSLDFLETEIASWVQECIGEGFWKNTCKRMRKVGTQNWGGEEADPECPINKASADPWRKIRNPTAAESSAWGSRKVSE